MDGSLGRGTIAKKESRKKAQVDSQHWLMVCVLVLCVAAEREGKKGSKRVKRRQFHSRAGLLSVFYSLLLISVE